MIDPKDLSVTSWQEVTARPPSRLPWKNPSWATSLDVIDKDEKMGYQRDLIPGIRATAVFEPRPF